MIRFLFRLLFKLRGWKIEGGIPSEIKKCVIVAAPHTSNWDFVFGLAAADFFKVDFKYLAKKELFKFPIKRLLLNTGGIPVERSKHTNLVDNIVEIFNSNESMIIMFPPEGTRGKVKRWKSGFYHVALKAQVPIVLGYLDYSKRTACLGTRFMPSVDSK